MYRSPVPMIALPPHFEAELRSWGELEPDTERWVRARLYEEYIVEAEYADRRLGQFYNYVVGLAVLTVAYTFGPRASATFLGLSLVLLIAFCHARSADLSPIPKSNSGACHPIPRLPHTRAVWARRGFCQGVAALAILYCADVAGQLPAVGDRRGFTLVWDQPWVAPGLLALCWAAAMRFSERAPPRKSVMEHMDAYSAKLRRGPFQMSSPRLRAI